MLPCASGRSTNGFSATTVAPECTSEGRTGACRAGGAVVPQARLVVAQKAAGSPAQTHSRFLARNHPGRGPKQAGQTHDCRGWVAHTAIGAPFNRGMDAGRPATGRVAQGAVLTSESPVWSGKVGFFRIIWAVYWEEAHMWRISS
jgi:hypothetical protein